MRDPGYFGPDSITWKLTREAVLLLGGARAVLMQLAHPLVALGVSDHSDYMHNPYQRTLHTFFLGQMLTFGTQQTARQAAKTINHLHTPVTGSLPNTAGTHKKGSTYYAHDPELLLWVHATLIDTILLTYPLFVGPLSLEEQDQYYQESKRLAHLLGLTDAFMPATIKDLQNYVHNMVYSQQLAATPQARNLAQTVLFPPVPLLLRPALHLHFHMICALLPPPVREIYGFEWSDTQQRYFSAAVAGMRTVIPHLPHYLRVLPSTQQMMKNGIMPGTIDSHHTLFVL